jgi:hypothetical protein
MGPSRIEAPGAMPNGTRVTATGVYKDGDSHRPGDLGTIVASLGPAKRLGFGDELHYTYFVEWDNPSDIPVSLADVRLRDVGRWSNAVVWMLYDHPRGYPSDFVAREFSYDEPTNEVLFFRSLEEARRFLTALGLACIGRHPEDDPEMIEVWL